MDPSEPTLFILFYVFWMFLFFFVDLNYYFLEVFLMLNCFWTIEVMKSDSGKYICRSQKSSRLQLSDQWFTSFLFKKKNKIQLCGSELIFKWNFNILLWIKFRNVFVFEYSWIWYYYLNQKIVFVNLFRFRKVHVSTQKIIQTTIIFQLFGFPCFVNL